ncbi:MAG TPA: hypothetical protein VGR62_07035 [Candidatus Binatia bacterium]|jgi:hypothetical protein|nr:hypothetical protein [Candidatus Binatia bacterium]
MSWLSDTLALYGRVFRRAGDLTARNMILLSVAVCYPMLLGIGQSLLAPLGIIGGVLWTLAAAAAMSSWLTLMEGVVRNGRADLRDVPASFVTYLSELINVGFLLFLLQMVAAFAFGPFPFLKIVFGLAILVFLNAIPELIYLGRYVSTDLLVQSYRFIGTNWIEWFPANLVLIAVLLAVAVVLPEGPYGIVTALAAGLVALFGGILRGLLFLELTTSSRRAREFQRRAAG